MNAEEKRDAPEPETPRREPEQEPTQPLEAESAPRSAEANKPDIAETAEGPAAEAIPPSPVEQEAPAAEPIASAVIEVALAVKSRGFFDEQPPQTIEAPPRILRHRTRRDVLLFGMGAIAALAGVGSVLPPETLERMGAHRGVSSPGKERFLNQALRIDDDVAEALYSPARMARTYAKSQITPLRNNYNGATPDPDYISRWNLTLDGLASGLSVSLDIRALLTRFSSHEQITRLVCVEGWSAVAWWSGLRFDDLLHAYPPMSQAKWARLDSSVNLDGSGNPDPYYVSLDLPTARHPQTLLATHFNGQPLTVEHGAPLRLLVPVKLGLKNVKAVTKISYVAEEPKDYWAERGYSRYDGI